MNKYYVLCDDDRVGTMSFGDKHMTLYLANTQENAIRIALLQDPFFIKDIDNPSELLKMEAVMEDGLAIAFIEEPSEEVQLAAVFNNADSIHYIKEPYDSVVRLAAQNIHDLGEASEELVLRLINDRSRQRWEAD